MAVFRDLQEHLQTSTSIIDEGLFFIFDWSICLVTHAAVAYIDYYNISFFNIVNHKKNQTNLISWRHVFLWVAEFSY